MHLKALDLPAPENLPTPPSEAARMRAPAPPPAVTDTGSQTAPRTRRALRLVLTATVLAALWAVLLPGDVESWWIGVPAIAIGAGFTLFLPAAPLMRVSPAGLLRFAAYFAVQSVIGAIDVARRALSLRPAIRPGFVTVVTRLPNGPARVLLANAITLLPGTLTAGMQGDRLLVHAIDMDGDPENETRELERLIAAMFRFDIGDK